jgi:hypothetical protein
MNNMITFHGPETPQYKACKGPAAPIASSTHISVYPVQLAAFPIRKTTSTKTSLSQLGLEMGRGGSKLLNHEPPLVDP